MRKLPMTILAFLLVATSVFAQGRRAGAGLEMLKELDLTTEQQDKIKAIKKDTRTKMEALHGESTKRGENREAFRALREESKTAVLGVLTPAQLTQLEARQAARKEAWKNVDKKGMRAELKAYREKEIEPVLRASRGQLDQYISAEDRQEIDRLRAVFETRPKRKGKGGKPGKAGKKGKVAKDEARTQAREAGKAWRTEHAADVESLKVLTKKYSVELERVQSLLTNRRITWNEEMAEIKGKYLPDGAKERRAQKGSKGKKKGDRRPENAERGDRHKQMKASAFLLLKG